jgi:ABC-2 type transport system ATP-binding protein
MPALIKIKNLRKQYGKKIILKNVNLDIKKGEIFGIIGMSGSGKTTFLNNLIGFLEPEEGDVLYKNKNKYLSVFEKGLELRKKFGFATQEPSFYPKLTIEENLEHFGYLYNLKKSTIKKNTTNLLKLIGLEKEKDQLAQELSGGMEKRLGIACALVHDPELLILDEPTANLDPVLRDDTWGMIKNIHKTGTTIIVASHLLEELEPICQRIGILHNCSLREVGTPDQLKGKYSKNEEVMIVASGQHEKIENLMEKERYVKKVKKYQGALIFYTPNPFKDSISCFKYCRYFKRKDNTFRSKQAFVKRSL